MKAPKGPDPIRTAHGKGASAVLRVEAMQLDELPPMNAEDTGQGLAMARRRGAPFTKGNKAAANRKPALCQLGVPLDTSDPRYRSAMRKAERYRARRVRETAVAHGGHLSAGPSAMFASAARALAASIVVNLLAGETLAAGDTKAAADLFKVAASLADSSRQQELTAVGLAAREAAARPKDPAAAVKAMRARILGEKT